MTEYTNASTDAILKDSIFIIGTVSSVDGRRVKIEVKKDKNLSHLFYKGKTIKNVSVGSYVKIAKGFIEIIGKVEGEYITKEKFYNKEYNKEELKISRFLEVSLFGHFDSGTFKQGIKEMPLIDNECYLLDRDEFNRLHQFYKNSEKTIVIGVLTEEPSQDIRLAVAKLFASHVGIFGNTGSGKSNTLARLFTELFEITGSNVDFKQNSHFVIIDFNGEYAGSEIITNNKKIYNLSTGKSSGDKYELKPESIERLEVVSVLLEATEKTQKPFLSRAIQHSYLDTEFDKRSKENIKKIVVEVLTKGDSTLGVQILIEFFNHLNELATPESSIKAILKNLQEGDLKFHSNSNTYYVKRGGATYYSNASMDTVLSEALPNLGNASVSSTNLDKLKFKILSQYYHEIVNGYSNPEHIRPLIGRMFKKFQTLEKIVSVNENPSINVNLEIINLKNVNLEMKKTLPLIIAKQKYDDHKDLGDFDNKSLHLVIDEAHNILSTVSERESETWKDYRLETFEEIIKEGRKFSTFLTIASQRPYDISPTIISQLHNYFIHRLINDHDIKAVEKTIAYLDKLSFESIPLLAVGSCFVAGLASDIPVKVDIKLLEKARQPRSETINLTNAWFK